jgi:universal stress protein A
MCLKTILVVTDFRPLGRAALSHAASLARESGAKLLVVHVVDPEPMLDHQQALSPELQELLAASVAQAQAKIDAIEFGEILNIQRLVLIGNPSDQIVALAAQDDVNVVVIGTSGTSAPSHGELGGTAQAVASRAKCRVITVSNPSRTSGHYTG